MDNLRKNNTALVVMDMQNDFCSSDGFLAKNLGVDVSLVQDMAPRLKKFIDRIRDSVKIIIFTQQNETPEDAPRTMRGLFEQGKLKPNCVPGSWGADFFLVKPTKTDIVLSKHSWDAFTNPELKKILESNDIENLIITGVFTNFCIESTFRRAFSEGYFTFIPKDLVTVNKNKVVHQEESLKFFDDFIGTLTSSDGILATLTKNKLEKKLTFDINIDKM